MSSLTKEQIEDFKKREKEVFSATPLHAYNILCLIEDVS